MIINKVLPQELKAEAKYAVKLRSINNLGTPSDWSPVIVIDTSAAGLASARRLVITNDGMIAYNSNGQITFNYSATAAIRTNLCTNPSGEIDTTGWTALANSTLSVTSPGSEYFVGVPGQLRSFKVLANAAIDNIGFVTETTKRVVVTPSLNYTVAAYVKVPVGQPSVSLKLGLRFYNAGGSLISETVSVNENQITGNNWIRINNVGMTVPAGTAKVGFVIFSSDPMPANSYYLVDGILIEQTSILRDYFDGSSSAGTSVWTGTAHDSASTLDNNGTYSVNGGVFTESTIQTSRTVTTTGGVIMDISGVRGYAAGNVKNFDLTSAGSLTLTGVVNATGGNFANTVTVGQNASKISIVGDGTSTGTKIYSGVGTYNNSNTPFFFDASGRFSLGTGLTYDGTNLAVVAAISGGTIDIGGFDTTSFHVDASGNLWLGASTYGAAPFRISSTGTIIARDASLSTTFTVDSGYATIEGSTGKININGTGPVILPIGTSPVSGGYTMYAPYNLSYNTLEVGMAGSYNSSVIFQNNTIFFTTGGIYRDNIDSSGFNITGNRPLNFSSWGGGWYMQDSVYMRCVGNKIIYTAGDTLTGGTAQAAYIRGTTAVLADSMYSFTSDGAYDTGMQWLSDGVFRALTNGSECMRWDTTRAVMSKTFDMNQYEIRFYNSSDPNHKIQYFSGNNGVYVASYAQTKFYLAQSGYTYRFDQNGNAYADNGSWINLSSIKIKTNIVEVEHEDAVQKLLALKPVYFQRKNNQVGIIEGEQEPRDSETLGLRQAGFIAEWTNEVIPEITTVDYDPEGEGGIDYGGFSTFLVSGFQWMYKRMEELEKKVAELSK